MSEIRYGRRNPIRAGLSHLSHFFAPPRYLYRSYFHPVDMVDVGCVMCVYNEQKTVRMAVESSKDFVSKYVIIDKNGDTLPIIEECRDSWDLDMETYIKPQLDLKNSRVFALSKLDNTWIFIQDGDEVVYTEGPRSIFSLYEQMNRSDIYFRTRMNILVDGFMTPLVQNGYHSFLYHNNGTIRAPRHGDIFTMTGRGIYLREIYKVQVHLGKKHYPRIIPYNRGVQGPIPSVIRRNLS